MANLAIRNPQLVEQINPIAERKGRSVEAFLFNIFRPKHVPILELLP